MIERFVPIGLMALVALLAAVGMLIGSYILGPKRMNPAKGYPYECGMPLLDEPRKRLSVRFYVIAALFIIFDLEVAFLYPWALVYRDLGFPGLIEMLVFLTVLFAGFVYLWRKGALEWK